MTIKVEKLWWTRTFLNLEYTVTEPDEQLLLFRARSKTWASFDEERDGNTVHASMNVMMGADREPLEAGDWYITTRVPPEEITSLETLYELRPHMKHLVRDMAKDELEGNDRKDKRKIDRVLKKTGELQLARTQPHDTHGIEYAPSILLNLESDARIFRYAGKYAYTAALLPKENLAGDIVVVLAIEFYIKNYKPRIRRGSLRFREKQILAAFFNLFSKVLPKHGNRVLFLKENGDAPTENMAALIRRMRERGLDSQFQIVERYRNTFKRRQSIKEWLDDLLQIAKADYIFIDDYCPVFNFAKIGKNTVLTQLWHAGVGFKSVGYARFGLQGSPDPFASSHRAYTYALVGNEHLRDIYSEVFGIEKEALLATGMPRLDGFLDEGAATQAREKLEAKYPWSTKGRVLLFAPTFRGEGQADAFYPYDLYFNMDELYKMCVETNSYFIFEMHHFVKDAPKIPAEYSDRIFDLSSERLNELFHIADVLITDYSSCFYDFVLLEKPVVFYTPDKLSYTVVRGVQRSIDEMAPGVVCDTFDDLMRVLENNEYQTVMPDKSTFDRCIENGDLATDRVIDTVLLGKDTPGVRLN